MRMRVWSGCFCLEQRCGQATSGDNKVAVRLLLAKLRVWSGRVRQEQGCSQFASGENKSVVKRFGNKKRVKSVTSPYYTK